MALHSLYCADVPLRNCSLTHPVWTHRFCYYHFIHLKVKADTALHGNPISEPYGITQCYLPPKTSERAPPYPSQLKLPCKSERKLSYKPLFFII